MRLICDSAVDLPFRTLCVPIGIAAARARPTLAATVNPGDEDDEDNEDDSKDGGNIEPDDDEGIADDDQDDQDEEPLWAWHCCGAPIPHRNVQPSYCAVTTEE
jgi:hypothetical protein